MKFISMIYEIYFHIFDFSIKNLICQYFLEYFWIFYFLKYFKYFIYIMLSIFCF